jgi:phosphatidylserine decarboxylase
MKIHKEGLITLMIVSVFILIVDYVVISFTHNKLIVYPLLAASFLLYVFIRYFFRVPNRLPIEDAHGLISPCDGKVVVIEDVFENEFLKCDCKQISIFMSPFNVHINWFPVSGKILFAKRSKGSHIVAWAPKSSTHNERSTVLIETDDQKKILVRQIAGAVARRVVCYAKTGEYADQNQQLGFIKFGSRVDLFIPNDYEIKVELDQKVIGSQTIIARLKK